MESWESNPSKIYTTNQTLWVELMNQSTSEWSLGWLPANVYAINGTLASSNPPVQFPDGAFVIEGAGVTTAGSAAIEDLIFGLATAAVLLSGIIWLSKTWCMSAWGAYERFLDPGRRPQKPGRSRHRARSTEMQPVPRDDGEGGRHDQSRISRGRRGTLAEVESGGRERINPEITYPSAQDFKEELLSKYYERIVSELEMLDDRGGNGDGETLGGSANVGDTIAPSTPRAVSVADIEALHELVRKRYGFELEIFGQSRSQDPAIVLELRDRSAAALDEIYRVVAEWTTAAHGWSPAERQYLNNIVSVLEAFGRR
ncbi:hypothetical protein PG985_014190 [Apiospora marii]|uniref:DUF4129 domain-containing protein n=1 Tax=Apiospora marii TaxID=335849 RepID=A0ABR1R601_9PEZI